MADNETKKKPRSKRRNFAAELAAVRNYVAVNIEILEDMGDSTDTPIQGKIAAFKAVLAKIGESK